MPEHGDFILIDGDLQFANGDVIIGDQKERLLGDIVRSNKGNFRRWVTLGVNLISKISGIFDSREIASNIQDNAVLDGWEIRTLQMDQQNDNLEITVVDAEKVTDDTNSLV